MTIETEEQIVDYAEKLQEMGARNVLISRGGDGAMLPSETGEVYTSKCSKRKISELSWSRRLHAFRLYGEIY